jgi:rhodanese-related sulfurtransferase
MPPTITRQQLQAMLAGSSRPLLLEALPAKYYLDGHLPGAVHFPHDQSRALAPIVIPDKHAEIVVYCASSTCQNSHIAARTLVALGYTKVGVYAGGKRDWLEAGLRVEQGGAVQQAA